MVPEESDENDQGSTTCLYGDRKRGLGNKDRERGRKKEGEKERKKGRVRESTTASAPFILLDKFNPKILFTAWNDGTAEVRRVSGKSYC